MERYGSYKDSGVEWVGEIPIHWEKSKVKYHFHLISGFPFSSEDITNEEREYPIIRIGNVTSGKTDVYFEGELSDKHPLVNYGDYVVSLTGDFSIRKWENKSSLLNQRCGLIRKFTSDDERFLFYYLPFQFRILEKTKYFTTLKNLSNGELLDIEFILPPLSEQQQIVSFLDTKTSYIDSLIKKTQRKIELLKEKRTSLINEVVTKGLNPNVEMKDSGVEWIGEIPSGWVVSKLKFYIEGIKDGTHGTHQNDDNGEILLSGKNVLNDELKITDNERRILKSEHEKIISNGYPKKGDVLVVSIGHTLGKVCTYDLDYSVSFQRSVCFIRPKDNISSRWLYYNIRSDYFQSQIKVKLNKSTIGGIYMGDLSDGYITVLPKSEQQQIVEYLDEQTQLIDKTISIEGKRIELLKEYRQSLISEVVTGKRKVIRNGY